MAQRRRTPSQTAYEQYLLQSRNRFRSGTTATVRQIEAIYDKALRDVTAEMSRLLPTQPSARHLSLIQGAISEARGNLSREVLDATLYGIGIATDSATTGAAAIAKKLLGSHFEAGGIDTIYQAVNQRAVLAFATRTRFDGLRLSDRIWQSASKWKGYVTRATESAIVTGTSARDLARTLDPYLKSGVARPSSAAVRRRLGIPKNISYQSLRVARTEMSSAFKEGTVLGHQKTPSYLGSQWELSSGHAFTDDCDDLASGGPNNDGIYPAGDEPLQPHPNCMCVLSPIHEDPAQFTSRLKAWADNPGSEPELEQWFQQVARPHLNGRPIQIPARPAVPVRVVSPARLAPRPAPPGIKKAIARSAPAPQRPADVSDGGSVQVATVDDEAVRAELTRAVEAERKTEAARAARAAEEAAEKARVEAEERIRALNAEMDDLERQASALEAPTQLRTAERAADEVLRSMKALNRPINESREQIALRFREAGIDEVTLERRVEIQRWINGAYDETQFGTTMRTAAMRTARPSLAITERQILGNGGTIYGEVYGHTVVLYDEALAGIRMAHDIVVAGEMRYHVGRAIYRNAGIIDSAQQQQFISAFQSLGRAQAERYVGEGVDRAEGLFGALFRTATSGDLTAARIGKWPDELVNALVTIEARIPKVPKLGQALIDKRQKAAAAKAKKEAKAALERSKEAFKNVPAIGKPGRSITRAQANEFLEGSSAPITYHRTSEAAVRKIIKSGVQMEANTTAMYGRGFYTATRPLTEYGRAEVQVVIHSRNPFVIEGHTYMEQLSWLTDRWDALNPGRSSHQWIDKIREQALAEGYDAIQVRHGGRMDYWIAIDLRNVRTITP